LIDLLIGLFFYFLFIDLLIDDWRLRVKGQLANPGLLVKTMYMCVCSASSELTISVSSHLEDEDLQQLQQTMKQTLARLTRFVA